MGPTFYLILIIIGITLLIFKKSYSLYINNNKKEHFFPSGLGRALTGISEFTTTFPELIGIMVDAMISFFMNFVDLFMSLLSVFEWIIKVPGWVVEAFIYLLAVIVDLIVILLTWWHPVTLIKGVIKLILALAKIIFAFIYDTVKHLIRLLVSGIMDRFKSGLWGVPHGPDQHQSHKMWGDSEMPIDESEFVYGDHHHDHPATFNYKPMRCYKEIGANGFINIIATIICPPLGVFMAYGIAGWFKLLVCSALTLLYYFPGLFYAFLITTHLGIGDDLEFSDCGGTYGGYIVKGCEHRNTKDHCDSAYLPKRLDKDGNKISACEWHPNEKHENKGTCRNYMFEENAYKNLILLPKGNNKTNFETSDSGYYSNYTEDNTNRWSKWSDNISDAKTASDEYLSEGLPAHLGEGAKKTGERFN